MLAPDPASVKAARGLSGAGSWSATGRLDDILWGQCRSYQVGVDLAGPAFKCSCPSRKIPCKHVLALLLRWAESDVSDAAAPAFAQEGEAPPAAARLRGGGAAPGGGQGRAAPPGRRRTRSGGRGQAGRAARRAGRRRH